VLVNILAPVIQGMAPALAARTRAAGWLIAAGLIDRQEAEVAAALGAVGLEVAERTQEADWVGLVARRR
jgi:ribosomal protein L11 methylase PrmA